MYPKRSQIVSVDVVRANGHAMNNPLHGNKKFHTYWARFSKIPTYLEIF